MGALHAGHMSLIAAAKRDHGRGVATVFVNPTQFGDPKDLETYPRTEAADLAMLEAAAIANAVFNACGARVRELPITPDKVLAALGRV